MTELPMAEISVSDTSELRAVLSQAAGPTRILLQPGEYSLALDQHRDAPWAAFSDRVEIASASLSEPATFTYLRLSGVQNLHFSDLVFDYTYDDDPYWHTPFSITSGSDTVSISSSVFDGDIKTTGELKDGLGYPGGVGIAIGRSSNILIEDSKISNFYRGVTVTYSDDIFINDNEIGNMRSDGIAVAQANGITIEDNYIHQLIPSPYTGDHRDLIQFWTATLTEPATDIVIRGNFLDSGTTGPNQSIFMRNEQVDMGIAPADEMAYRNVLIENNVIHNGHLHGIAIGATYGIDIRNNTVLNNPVGAESVPIIKLDGMSQDVSITQNIVSELVIPENEDWLVQDNFFAQDTSILVQNHYDTLFVNARAGDLADLEDLQAQPGGLIETLGVGAPQTVFDSTPDALTALPMVREDASVHGAFSFNGAFTANPDGLVGSQDAEFRWDFGDGAFATGVEVGHTYSAPGTYLVRLEVAHSDGSLDVGVARAVVPETNLLSIAVDGGQPRDLSPFSETIAIDGALDLVPGRDGQQGFRVAEDVTISVGRHEIGQIANKSALSILLGLKAETATSSDAGGVFAVYPDHQVYVEGDGEMRVVLRTSDGEFEARTTGANLLDGDWHDIAVIYDDFQNSMQIYVDGESRANADASGVTKAYPSAPLYVGAPWRQDFAGAVDYVEVVGRALSSEEVAARVAGATEIGPPEGGEGPETVPAPEFGAPPGSEPPVDRPDLPPKETSAPFNLEVERLYQSAFDRGADDAGLEFWSTALLAGAVSPLEAAEQFVKSNEFQALYGDLGSDEVDRELLSNAPWISEDLRDGAELVSDAGGDPTRLLEALAFGGQSTDLPTDVDELL